MFRTHREDVSLFFWIDGKVLLIFLLTRLLSSRLMRVTDARHKITFSFIIQLTYVMCNSGWYGYMPYECHFL